MGQLLQNETRQLPKALSFCPILIRGYRTHALLDSGNLAGNAMSWQFAQEVGITEKDIRELPHMRALGTAKRGQRLSVKGELRNAVDLRLGGLPFTFKTRPLIIDGLSMHFNISGPYMAAKKWTSSTPEESCKYKATPSLCANPRTEKK